MKKPDPDSTVNELMQLVESYLPSNIDDSTETRRLDLYKNPQFNALLEHAPSLVFILNHQTMLYDYFSKNVKQILGYDADRYMKEGLAFSTSTFHPEHLDIHNRLIYPEIYEYIKNYGQKGESKSLRFTTTFKVKKADGKYIWAMQQFNIIETDDAGLPFLTLVFMHDITYIKKDECVDLLISHKTSPNSTYIPIYAATYPGINKPTVFSKRELEVLNLICKGVSSKEIANSLFLSEHTVKTHRKNMLKKINAKNTADLLRFAMNKGLMP